MANALPSPSTAATPPRLRRRAVDVAVVGDSLSAYAAAYLLAKRGKRVVLLEHAAPQLVLPPPPPAAASSSSDASPARHPGHRRRCIGDVVLHLPAATPHLVNAATESLALWRGLEAAAGAKPGRLLHLCGSVDLAYARGGSAAGDALDAMQDACKAAGLAFGVLGPDEVSAAFPRLRPPSGTAALYTNLGAVVQGRMAASALAALAQRAGAETSVAAGGDALCLLGWRDGGSHFVLRAGSAAAVANAMVVAAAAAAGRAGRAAASGGRQQGLGPPAAAGLGGIVIDDEQIFECEQLLLLPEPAAQAQVLALFGLAVAGAALWRVPAARWRAPQDLGGLPIWQLLGTGSTRRVDDPAAVDACWGLPLLGWAPGSLLVAQALADGEPAVAAAVAGESVPPGEQQGGARAVAAAGAGAAARGSMNGGPSGVQLQRQLAAAAGVAAASASVASPGGGDYGDDVNLRPGSEESVDAARQAAAAAEQRQRGGERRLAAAGALAGQMLYGLGEQLADGVGGGGDAAASAASAALQALVTPDGEAGVGSHPGFEAGRVVAAFCATGSGAGCLPGEQGALLVARLAVGHLLGQPAAAAAEAGVSGASVALGREGLGAGALELRSDTWAELGGNLVAGTV